MFYPQKQPYTQPTHLAQKKDPWNRLNTTNTLSSSRREVYHFDPKVRKKELQIKKKKLNYFNNKNTKGKNIRIFSKDQLNLVSFSDHQRWNQHLHIRPNKRLQFVVSACIASDPARRHFYLDFLAMKQCPIAAKIAGLIGILPRCVLSDFFNEGYERLPDFIRPLLATLLCAW